VRRIKLRGNPNKMILNRDQSRLFVTADNSDTVTVIDTGAVRLSQRFNYGSGVVVEKRKRLYGQRAE